MANTIVVYGSWARLVWFGLVLQEILPILVEPQWDAVESSSLVLSCLVLYKRFPKDMTLAICMKEADSFSISFCTRN